MLLTIYNASIACILSYFSKSNICQEKTFIINSSFGDTRTYMPTWPTSHQSNSLVGKRSANWAFFPKLEDEEVGNPLTPDSDQKSPLKSLLSPAKGPGSLDRQKTFRQLKQYASQTAQVKTVAQPHACWQMPRGENRLPPSQSWCLLAPQLSQCLVSEKAKQEARICIPPASNKALPASVETTHCHPTVTKCRSPSPLE